MRPIDAKPVEKILKDGLMIFLMARKLLRLSNV